MSHEAHLPYTLAAISTVGGVIGYYKSRSVMSLVGGTTVGVLYGLSGYMISKGEGEQGHALGLGTSMMLTGMMTKRYVKTRALMPSGMLATVGVGGIGYHGVKYNDWRKW